MPGGPLQGGPMPYPRNGGYPGGQFPMPTIPGNGMPRGGTPPIYGGGGGGQMHPMIMALMQYLQQGQGGQMQPQMMQQR
jgi:hypothetical protein